MAKSALKREFLSNELFPKSKMHTQTTRALVEVVPPFKTDCKTKNYLGPEAFRRYIQRIKEMDPNVTIVVTTRPKIDCIYWAKAIKEEFQMNVILNITCIGETLNELDVKLQKIKENGIEDLLVLRGYSHKIDVKRGELKSGLDFLKYITNEKNKGKYNFNLGVPAYPEGHPSSNYHESTENFLEKARSGASFAITQASYNIEQILTFYKDVREQDVQIPIYFGVLPMMNKDVVYKKAPASKVKVPLQVLDDLKEKDDAFIKRYGQNLLVHHFNKLMERNESNFCLFSMNSNESLEFSQVNQNPNEEDLYFIKSEKRMEKKQKLSTIFNIPKVGNSKSNYVNFIKKLIK